MDLVMLETERTLKAVKGVPYDRVNTSNTVQFLHWEEVKFREEIIGQTRLRLYR